MSRQNGALDDVGYENSSASANSDYYDHVDEGRAAVYEENKNDRDVREISDSSMTRGEDGYSDKINGDSKDSSSGYLTAIEPMPGQATPSDQDVTNTTTVFSKDQGQSQFMNSDNNNLSSGFNNINESPNVTTSQNESHLRESDQTNQSDYPCELTPDPDSISNYYIEIIEEPKVCMQTLNTYMICYSSQFHIAYMKRFLAHLVSQGVVLRSLSVRRPSVRPSLRVYI